MEEGHWKVAKALEAWQRACWMIYELLAVSSAFSCCGEDGKLGREMRTVSLFIVPIGEAG